MCRLGVHVIRDTLLRTEKIRKEHLRTCTLEARECSKAAYHVVNYKITRFLRVLRT